MSFLVSLGCLIKSILTSERSANIPIDKPFTSRPRNLLLAWWGNDQSKRQETIWLEIVTANQIDLTSKRVWMGVPKIADHKIFLPFNQ